MSEFESWRSFSDFADRVKRQARYIHDHKVQEFLSTLLATSEGRRRPIRKGKLLWRAQLGHDTMLSEIEPGYTFDQEIPLPPERMKPLLDRAVEGRANPKGISYLYLSTDRDTAIAEVRPWLGSLVSVGWFKVLHDLSLIDCFTTDTGLKVEPEDLEGLDPVQRERFAWMAIDRAFSEPVTPNDGLADYIPTQVIAESFKSRGHDGILYRSALGTGLNVALFNLDVAKLVACYLYQVTSVKFETKQVRHPYIVAR